LIIVDDDNAIVRPPERHCALPERILPLRALGVLDDLPESRLPDVEIGEPCEVFGADLVVLVHVEAPCDDLEASAIRVRRSTSALVSLVVAGARERRPSQAATATGAQ
jgi:hypothetical protein